MRVTPSRKALRARSTLTAIHRIATSTLARQYVSTLQRAQLTLPRPQACQRNNALSGQTWRALPQRQSHPRTLSNAPTPQTHNHSTTVEQISTTVQNFYSRGEKFRIYHGSTNSTRKSAMGRDPRKVVDTSSLNHVLSVDKSKMTTVVEPNVAMDELVAATLEFGLVPRVVMEFPGITVGGGYAGTAGESSSFRHGFFDRTLNWVEMVLANGDVVRCSENEREDLFRGAAGAVGTLGVVTLVEIQLQEAKKFVETTYHPVGGMDEAIETLRKFTEGEDQGIDYVDGLMFSQDSGVIVTGRPTNETAEDLPVQRFSRPKDPWFYLHAQEQVKKRGPAQETIPLPEYLFRYDRGGFWVGKSAFNYFPGIPFANWTRRFLDDFLHTRMLYNALHGSGQSERLIVQDLALPYATAKSFVDYTSSRFGIWPLWLCPLRQSPWPTMHPHSPEASDSGKKLELMLNIGLWGEPQKRNENFVQANRDLESKLQELGGMKWHYGQVYFEEVEFWRDFDREWYEKLRAKYHATGLPSVYDKVKVNTEAEKEAAEGAGWWEKLSKSWPLAGAVGLRRSIASGDYLKSRDPPWRKWSK